MAYNPGDNEYAVIWTKGIARINASTGALVGGVVPLGITGAPAAVFNTQSKRYAVLHSSGNGKYLHFALRDTAGKGVGSSTVYFSPTGYQVDTNGGNNPAALAYNNVNNEYGVAFRRKPTAGGTLYTAAHLFLQVNLNGAVLSKQVVVPQTELGLREPTLRWGGLAWGMAWTLRSTTPLDSGPAAGPQGHAAGLVGHPELFHIAQ